MMILDAHLSMFRTMTQVKKQEKLLNQAKLDGAIGVVSSSPSFNKHTRLMMSDATLNAMSYEHFYDDRISLYKGIKIIQDESLPYGEVVILTQFA